MSEEKKQELLAEIKEALSDVPAEHQKEVGKAIAHDIGVMAKAIKIATNHAEQEGKDEPSGKAEQLTEA